MDIFAILDQYGVPLSMCAAFGYFIWKQNQFIQKELMDELDESFKRLENIVIGLINAQKQHSIDLKGLRESYHAIVKIITNLMKKEKKKNNG